MIPDTRNQTPDTPRNRGGAPVRNQNGVHSGLSSLATTGRVPTKLKGGLYVRRQVRKLRREMFAEFVALHSRDPGIHEHIALKVAARAEARAMLHERMLALEWESLTHEQRTTSLTAIGAAGDQLVRMSREAGLNHRADAGNLQERLRLIQARTAAQDASAQPEANGSTATCGVAQVHAGDAAQETDSPTDTRGP